MKIFKIIASLAVGFVVLLLLFIGSAYVVSSRAMGAEWDITPVSVQTSTDSATLAHGQHVAEIRGCLDCHNSDLSGRIVVDAMPVMGRIAGSNLTSGQGGVPGSYSDEDWVRAIRHGVGSEGQGLLFMPSYEFSSLGPQDLGALISYIKSVPPVDKERVKPVFGPLPRVLYMLGQFPLVAPELIDHDNLSFEQPEAAVTVEFGGYLSAACMGCHGAGFSGGKVPGGDPSWPPAGNLTPHASGLESWSLQAFHSFAETGVTPDGREINPDFMPWPLLGAFTEDERAALWTYLETLPATEKGNR